MAEISCITFKHCEFEHETETSGNGLPASRSSHGTVAGRLCGSAYTNVVCEEAPEGMVNLYVDRLLNWPVSSCLPNPPSPNPASDPQAHYKVRCMPFACSAKLRSIVLLVEPLFNLAVVMQQSEYTRFVAEISSVKELVSSCLY